MKNIYNDYREITVLVRVDQLAALYALLAGVSAGAVAIAVDTPVPTGNGIPAGAADIAAPVEQAEAGSVGTETELDSAGWPWSPDLHASTRGKTKEGLWRMKVGVARPDPKPGFPATAAAAEPAGTSASAGAAGTGAAPVAPASSADEDDEFAAFRAANEAASATDAAAAASVPARQWTDADLSALCNQAAQKTGNPEPVKAIIARFTPEGQTPHSRNIPADQREPFAKAVESEIGIQFAG